ncbi:hypothetical protein LTR36_003388 [Oleoguttula mirabilis]|uniref:Centromere protein X n=1 Tax=Oleoguttula mirabilis TaxID=1507867 RepID=A0AAV9JJN5_9PEZI|nr:hypothetical protein LTR36_003388 [Oleoguttula mirabilis]
MPPKKMPPRKEPKETVVYPASKRKGPAFKPQRPSKVPRIPTTESESSRPKSAKKAAPAIAPARKLARPQIPELDDEDDEDDEDIGAGSARAGAGNSDSSEELADDPLAARPRAKLKAKAKAPAKPPSASKRKVTTYEASLAFISSPASARSSPAPAEPPPVPSQSSDIPQIPRNLIIRLLHEHFADKKTQIDKQAIQVLQKYVEVFVREAIARTALQKKEAAERFDVSAEDAGWLELEDLEKVAPGMMLDF